MADETFQLPGSSYKELVKIIQAYGVLNKEVVPAQVGDIAGMHESNVSRNNKFLVAAGIVQGGRSKKVTPLGQELALALHHNMPSEVTHAWRKVVSGTEFFQKVLAAIRIRKGMDESTLQAHVAYSAGQPKTPTVMAGAAAVVEILKSSGVLRDESGTLVAISEEPIEELETPPFSQPTISSSSGLQLPVVSATAQTGITVSIQIQVQCSPDQLKGLGGRLRELLADLSQPAHEREDVRGPEETESEGSAAAQEE